MFFNLLSNLGTLSLIHCAIAQYSFTVPIDYDDEITVAYYFRQNNELVSITANDEGLSISVSASYADVCNILTSGMVVYAPNGQQNTLLSWNQYDVFHLVGPDGQSIEWVGTNAQSCLFESAFPSSSNILSSSSVLLPSSTIFPTNLTPSLISSFSSSWLSPSSSGSSSATVSSPVSGTSWLSPNPISGTISSFSSSWLSPSSSGSSSATVSSPVSGTSSGSPSSSGSSSAIVSSPVSGTSSGFSSNPISGTISSFSSSWLSPSSSGSSSATVSSPVSGTSSGSPSSSGSSSAIVSSPVSGTSSGFSSNPISGTISSFSSSWLSPSSSGSNSATISSPVFGTLSCSSPKVATNSLATGSLTFKFANSVLGSSTITSVPATILASSVDQGGIKTIASEYTVTSSNGQVYVYTKFYVISESVGYFTTSVTTLRQISPTLNIAALTAQANKRHQTYAPLHTYVEKSETGINSSSLSSRTSISSPLLYLLIFMSLSICFF